MIHFCKTEKAWEPFWKSSDCHPGGTLWRTSKHHFEYASFLLCKCLKCNSLVMGLLEKPLTVSRVLVGTNGIHLEVPQFPWGSPQGSVSVVVIICIYILTLIREYVVYSDSILTPWDINKICPPISEFSHCHGLYIVSKTYLSQQKNKQMNSITTLVCITVSDKVCRERCVCVFVFVVHSWSLDTFEEEVGELKWNAESYLLSTHTYRPTPTRLHYPTSLACSQSRFYRCCCGSRSWQWQL